MNHPVIQQLMDEHQGILRMLRILDSVCGRLDAGREVPADDLAGMVEFLQVFADRCHHAKEEGHLFPTMVAAGFPGTSGPIPVMLAEHDRARAFVRGMAAAIEAWKKQGGPVPAAFGANARGYIDLLRDHIRKEDEILYPMAMDRVPEAALDGLDAAFEKVETEIVGAGKHEAFHHLLDELERAYAA